MLKKKEKGQVQLTDEILERDMDKALRELKTEEVGTGLAAVKNEGFSVAATEEKMEQFQQITRNTMRGEVSIPCNLLNCFCMYSEYVPLGLDEWIEYHENKNLRRD